MQSHTALIDEDDISSTVSIHRIAAAPGPERNNHVPGFGHVRQSDSFQKMSDKPRQQNEQVPEAELRKTSLQSKLAEKKLVG